MTDVKRSLFNDYCTKMNELETQLAAANQRIAELEAAIDAYINAGLGDAVELFERLQDVRNAGGAS